ncbi:MAG TPA: bacteriohemerythrin [Patescibacteria group bacterium]|nr:bacteriohemerythrin [Patescibacteria group bacterium]
MISWKEEYAIGADAIDTQHRRLFEIADEMYDLLNNDLVTDKYDRIMEIINELSEYTVYHFKAEETFMQAHNYRKFLSHKALHQDFLDKLNEVDAERIDNGQNEYLRGILAFVCDWLVEHILREDKLITAAQ